MRLRNRHKSVTAVLNCHREGDLLERSFRSVLESLRTLDGSGAGWELLCVADNCDSRTVAVLNASVASVPEYDVRVIPSAEGDLGLSRNLAIKSAAGEYIGFVDADDLVSRNWFSAAYRSNNEAPRSIFHPECNLYFGCLKAFFVHRNQAVYDLRALFFHNLWSALSFAHSETYKSTMYRRNRIDQGFGYEDWNWNCETILGGHEHRVVPGTCHFVRMKEGSLSQSSARNECLIQPTDLWKYLSRGQIGGHVGKWSHTVLSWIGRNQRSRNRRQMGFVSDKMFYDPDDLIFEEAPVWMQESLAAAQADDSSIDLSGCLTNFSPLIESPFVPYFSDAAFNAASRGVDTIHFFDSSQTLKRVLPSISSERVFAITERSTEALPENVLWVENLETQLGYKFEMYLAMLAVQSRCRELHIWNSTIGLRVLAKYKLALRSAVSRVHYHGDPASCPEDLRPVFDACLSIS